MKLKNQVLATGFFLFSLMLPVKAMAANVKFSQIFSFGDSLVDTGNTFGFTGEVIPPESFGYFDGRFTNNENWIDYLSQDLELAPLPTFFDTATQGANPMNGVNFAFGGALTGTFMTGDDMKTPVENTLPPTFPPLQNLPFPLLGLQSQVGLFAQNFAPIANDDALYIVWAGANDYLPTDANPNLFRPLTETDTTVNNISLAINNLVGLGAKNLMVVNLPDLGAVPVGQSNSQDLTDLSTSHNQNLELIGQNLPSDVNLINFDVNTLFNTVVNNPDDFELTNVTQGCLVVGCNPNDFLFWDTQHPTSKGHRIIADAALEALKPVPEGFSPMGVLAFGLWGTLTVVKRQKEAGGSRH